MLVFCLFVLILVYLLLCWHLFVGVDFCLFVVYVTTCLFVLALVCLCLHYRSYSELTFLLSLVCVDFCLFVVYFANCLCLHYRSYSERVQRSSYESYAPGYVPSRDSFRRQKGIKSGQPARQIFIDKEVCLVTIYRLLYQMM